MTQKMTILHCILEFTAVLPVKFSVNHGKIAICFEGLFELFTHFIDENRNVITEIIRKELTIKYVWF